MKYWLVIFAFCGFSALAKGLSPYLPLQISPEIELYIEKLFAITETPPLIKPYKALDILTQAEEIKHSHPQLYGKITTYLQRYKKRYARTHSTIELSHSNDNASLANQRGADYQDSFRISTTGYYQYNPYTIFSLGVEIKESDSPLHYASYVGFGYEYAQVEVGYRDHWFSPFQDSSMLTSINAAPSPSITLSNATPISNWNLRYEVFASELEELEVPLEGLNASTYTTKRPKLAGIHLSFAPLPNWVIGLNRTVQYGDNLRDLAISDLINNFVDPNDPDNAATDKSNHLASITSKLNINLGLPVSLYAEYGGETSKQGSGIGFGEETISFGVFLPQLLNTGSLRYEYNQWSEGWYIHDLFNQGYSNKGNVIGHWAAEQYLLGNNEDTQVHSLMMNTETIWQGVLEVTMRRISTHSEANYETGYDTHIRYSQASRTGFWGLELSGGSDVLGKNYRRISVFYRW